MHSDEGYVRNIFGEAFDGGRACSHVTERLIYRVFVAAPDKKNSLERLPRPRWQALLNGYFLSLVVATSECPANAAAV